MTDEKSPIEQALDLFVYAPVGLAASVLEHLPEWVAKGRDRVTGQAAMARMMGEYAVGEAQKEAEKALRQASETLAGLTGGGASPDPGPAPQTSAASPPSPASTPPAAPVTPPPAAPPLPPSPPRPPAPSVDALAIPGYDALSASQVVQRLAGLARDELEAVREYESATRGRKTILHRVDQLQNGQSS